VKEYSISGKPSFTPGIPYLLNLLKGQGFAQKLNKFRAGQKENPQFVSCSHINSVNIHSTN